MKHFCFTELLTHDLLLVDVKRLIGQRFSDKPVQESIKVWPFKVVAGDREDWPIIEVQYKGEETQFTPEQISARRHIWCNHGTDEITVQSN